MLLPHGTRKMGGGHHHHGNNNNNNNNSPTTGGGGSGSSSGGSLFVTSRLFVVMMCSAIPAFFLGTTMTLYATVESAASSCSLQDPIMQSHIQDVLSQKEAEFVKRHDATVERKVQEKLIQLGCDVSNYDNAAAAAAAGGTRSMQQQQHAPNLLTAARRKKGDVYTTQEDLLDSSKIGNYVRGMALVPKSNLTHVMDMGVPLDPLKEGSDHVLMIYSRDQALPNVLNSEYSPMHKLHPSSSSSSSLLPVLDMETATAKCDYVHVILTDHSKQRNQCLAIVPQYESFHLQKWMRIDPHNGGRLDSTRPLQLVSRGQKATGRNEFDAPSIRDTRKMWDMLRLYLDSVDNVLQELDVVLKRIADVNNTVIVMVCNFGQSELLMNFVCSSKKRGFDLSNIVVFTTDQETTDLAHDLGLATYYDKRVRIYNALLFLFYLGWCLWPTVVAFALLSFFVASLGLCLLRDNRLYWLLSAMCLGVDTPQIGRRGHIVRPRQNHRARERERFAFVLPRSAFSSDLAFCLTRMRHSQFIIY
jgi:hypothetical protein